MLLKKLKRCSTKLRTKYSNQAQEYLKTNGLILVQKICDGVLGANHLEEEKVKEVLGTDYPIAPWVDSTDIISQFVCLLEEAGYVFAYDENGNVHFKNEELYEAIVENHLRFSGRNILDKLSECCEQMNGRISYHQLQMILGFHYPRAPYASKTDKKVCIIMFLRATGLPFKFDNNYVYFP